MQNPLVSIVIPIPDAPVNAQACVDAVFAQGYARREIVLVCSPDKAPALPKDAPDVRTVRSHAGETPAETANRGLRAARGDVRVLLMPNCVPADSRWLERIARSFEDDAVGAVVSQARMRDKKALPTAARVLASIVSPELTTEADEPVPIELVSHLCDAYRADVLSEVGYLEEGTFPSPGEAVDVSLKIARSGRRIVLSPDAVVFCEPAPDAASVKNLLRSAIAYGHADAALVKLHNVDWLGTGVFGAALLSLLLIPVGLLSLPVGVILAGALFVWGWFLAIRTPVLRWEWPVAVINLLVYITVIMFVRVDWARSTFDPYTWHPAVIRQWCILAAMTGSYVLIVLGAGVRTTVRGMLRGYVRGPLSALAVFSLATVCHLLSGAGFLKGYVASHMHPSETKH